MNRPPPVAPTGLTELFACFPWAGRMRRPGLALVCFAASLGLAAGVSACRDGGAQAGAPQQVGWRGRWAVSPGFSLSVDSRGYTLPTSIAFVPDPDEGPDDPLYFVTEMNGSVKVVTNSRRALEFAKLDLNLGDDPPKPFGLQEVGAAGICLDREHGYVFVTYVYRDSAGVLRNNITRFASEPRRFGLRPRSSVSFTEIFAAHVSAPSHQIGPCQVRGDTIMVSVGDGENAPLAQQLDAVQGKILRMSVDGAPLPDNPFYEDSDRGRARNFVWALGLRNPFGLKWVGDRVFAVGNGPDLDNFVEIFRGRNYQWDGSDLSMGGNTIQVISPSLSPVQLEYLSATDSVLPPEYRGTFYTAIAGSMHSKDPAQRLRPGIMQLGYDLDARIMREPPSFVLRYLGSEMQMLVGLARGPDALYFVPLFPDSGETSVVYRLAFDPATAHPVFIGDTEDSRQTMIRFGCFGCHQIGSFGGSIAPALDAPDLVDRVLLRLESDEYARQVASLDSETAEPFVSYRESRSAVLRARGNDKVRTWIKYRLLEPRFDSRDAGMPKLGLTERQAENLALVLTGGSEVNSERERYFGLARLIPDPSRKLVVLAFGVGGLLGAIGYAVLMRLRAMRLRK